MSRPTFSDAKESKNTAAFGLVMGGKLKLKGDKKKKRKHREEEEDDDEDDAALLAQLPSYSADPQLGDGKLTSSGVVVMGVGTDFSAALAVGDTLLVTVTDRFRNTQSDEERVVNMVLGKTSLNVAAPFSCDLTSPTSFMFVKKAPDVEALRAAKKEEKRRAKQRKEEDKTVTYKVVVPGSGTWKTWKQVTEKAGTMSRDDMLQRRIDNKSDRHCR